MTASTYAAHPHRHVLPLRRLPLKVVGIGTALPPAVVLLNAAHATVMIVPVVSELLNLIENVSPSFNVNADP
jgi:hypothetical protein